MILSNSLHLFGDPHLLPSLGPFLSYTLFLLSINICPPQLNTLHFTPFIRVIPFSIPSHHTFPLSLPPSSFLPLYFCASSLHAPWPQSPNQLVQFQLLPFPLLGIWKNLIYLPLNSVPVAALTAAQSANVSLPQPQHLHHLIILPCHFTSPPALPVLLHDVP